jgi:hypothetical protein
MQREIDVIEELFKSFTVITLLFSNKLNATVLTP